VEETLVIQERNGTSPRQSPVVVNWKCNCNSNTLLLVMLTPLHVTIQVYHYQMKPRRKVVWSACWFLSSYSKCHVTSNKVTSKLECAEDKFQRWGWDRETPPATTYARDLTRNAGPCSKLRDTCYN
jgi:hypothetical protein